MLDNAVYFMNCRSYTNEKFRVTMGTICYMFCTLEIYIADLTKRDSGVYFLENTRYTCRHLTLTVTVLDVELVCSAFLPNIGRDIIMACKWNSHTHKELRLFSRDRIQYTNDINNQTNNSISAIISIYDIFRKVHFPRTCSISRFGYQKTKKSSCTFPIFMSPKVKRLTDEGSTFITFSCCSTFDGIPNVWWYDARNMSLKGKVNEISFPHFLALNSIKGELIILCGKDFEKRHIYIWLR